MKKRGVIAVAIVCAVALILLWASKGIQLPKTFNSSIYDFEKGQQPGPDADGKLKVMTWNIAYSYGIGSSAEGYAPHTAEEMNDSLNRIGNAIKDSGADLVLLQEIDFDSDRSYNINQMEEISQITGLRYAAPAISWKANYVPFPYWPPNHHFGRMLSGGAVLSRYPIILNQVTLHPKPKGNNFVYNMFYLFRYSQHVQLQVNNVTIDVVNNHLEAFDKANREKQAYLLQDIFQNFLDEGRVVIAGGDMNAIPSEADAKNNFPDDDGVDHQNDTTLEILKDVQGINEIVGDEDYAGNESAFFTFPANEPNRRLDYIFVSNTISVENAAVMPVGELSDHLPVTAELTLP
jgi:endonuclease/exonuclease/phosphatase family metal-dependent hydrolase